MDDDHADAFLAYLDARIRAIRKELAEVPARGSFRKERELLLAEVEGIRLAFMKIMGKAVG